MEPEADLPTLFERSLELLLRGDLEGWLHCCAEDVVFEFPFAPDDRPAKVEGRAALRDYLSRYPGQVTSRSVQRLRILRAAGAEVLVVEMTVRGTRRGTNSVLDSSFIAVVTYSGGLITRYRDYWNPAGGKPVEESGVAA
jgi:ketosteroid isomerase-like protein